MYESCTYLWDGVLANGGCGGFYKQHSVFYVSSNVSVLSIVFIQMLFLEKTIDLVIDHHNIGKGVGHPPTTIAGSMRFCKKIIMCSLSSVCP